MSHELATLFAAGLIYLILLFLVAYATDRGILPSRWAAHPLTYTLSIGVYATSWTYYGSVGYAAHNGLLFLTIYLGATLAFILSPVLLKPILRVSREYQLTSLADLLAFRYRSQAAGVLVTLFMLLGTMPYIALQIRAVTESLQVLSNEVPSNTIALVFCGTLILFGVLFGTRHISPREKHRGLVVAIAFESLIKLVVLLLIGGAVLALGSDCPVASPNPFEGIHAAVTRQRLNDQPAGGWHPEQRLTVAEAVAGYTAGPAYATGLSDRLGSITPGKLADLVVLDRDIFAVPPAEIAGTRPVMTIFDGVIVHDAGKLA